MIYKTLDDRFTPDRNTTTTRNNRAGPGTSGGFWSTGLDHVSSHFYLGFPECSACMCMLYLLVYHQYSLVSKKGPPHKQDTFA